MEVLVATLLLGFALAAAAAGFIQALRYLEPERPVGGFVTSSTVDNLYNAVKATWDDPGGALTIGTHTVGDSTVNGTLYTTSYLVSQDPDPAGREYRKVRFTTSW